MKPEIIMEDLTFLKGFLSEKDLLRVFDYMLSDLITNRGYEDQIDFDICVDQALSLEKIFKIDKMKMVKIYEACFNIFVPLAKEVYKILEKNSKVLYERLINSEKIDDLPSVYKEH